MIYFQKWLMILLFSYLIIFWHIIAKFPILNFWKWWIYYININSKTSFSGEKSKWAFSWTLAKRGINRDIQCFRNAIAFQMLHLQCLRGTCLEWHPLIFVYHNCVRSPNGTNKYSPHPKTPKVRRIKKFANSRLIGTRTRVKSSKSSLWGADSMSSTPNVKMHQRWRLQEDSLSFEEVRRILVSF